MSLGLCYDPCFKCPHLSTKQMCSMCELTLRREGVITTLRDTDYSFDKEQWETYLSEKQTELNNYVDIMFNTIYKKLEEEYEEKENKR